MARHYGFAVVPARPRKPRDKAKVENGVLLAERWILAALRNRRFTSLGEVREAVAVLLEKLNTRPMRKLGKSRRQLFEEVERAALKPLPDKPYELAHWKKARVNVDYHVELEGHCYSVPYGLVGQQMEVRYTQTCVEVLLGGRRVASHVRSEERGRFTTLAEHMPASHRAHAEWTPSGCGVGAPGEQEAVFAPAQRATAPDGVPADEEEIDRPPGYGSARGQAQDPADPGGRGRPRGRGHRGVWAHGAGQPDAQRPHPAQALHGAAGGRQYRPGARSARGGDLATGVRTHPGGITASSRPRGGGRPSPAACARAPTSPAATPARCG